MTTKTLVLTAIAEAMEEYAKWPADAYLHGRVSGLLSAAMLGDIISSKEHDEFYARLSETSRARSRQMEQETGA